MTTPLFLNIKKAKYRKSCEGPFFPKHLIDDLAYFIKSVSTMTVSKVLQNDDGR